MLEERNYIDRCFKVNTSTVCRGRSVSLFNLVLTVIYLYLLFVFQIMSVKGSY